MQDPSQQPNTALQPENTPNADRRVLVDELQDSPNGKTTQGQTILGEDRLLVLCDGVFAIAMTLLVLNIRLPSGLTTEAKFNQHLRDALFQVLTYVITFVIIASYWSQHRRVVRDVERIDARFTWLTFLFLAFVAFFPVTSSILGEYDYRGAVILYTLGFACCGFSLIALWLYAAWNGRLLERPLPRQEVLERTLDLALTPTYFLLSLLLLLIPVPPTNIFWSWLLVPIIYRVIRSAYRRSRRREVAPEKAM